MSQIGKPPCDDALILRAAHARPCTPSAQRWVLVAAIGGSSMAFVDGTVVNVALPTIQHALNATAFEAQWVVESYALFWRHCCSLVAPWGPLRSAAYVRCWRRTICGGIGRLRTVTGRGAANRRAGSAGYRCSAARARQFDFDQRFVS